MSRNLSPRSTLDTPPAAPDEAQPNVDPERPLNPPEEPERVDPDLCWIPLADRRSQQPDTWRRSGEEP